MRSILFIFLTLVQVQLLAQHITQVKIKDLEDGLNERVVNRIARDTFGFFYIFTDNFIQRYDGSDFEQVEIPIGAERLLKSLSKVVTNNNGGLLVSSDKTKKVIQIPPAGLKSNYIPENQSTYSDIFKEQKLFIDGRWVKYVIRDKDTIVADRGSFWRYSDGNFSQLGYNDEVDFHCNSISQDNFGNIIAAFGYSINETDSILVLRTTGEISDYSDILNHNYKIKYIYSDDINHRCMLATFNGLYIISFRRKGIEVYHDQEIATSSGFGAIVMTVSADGPDVLMGDENYGLRRITSTGGLEILYPEHTTDFFDNERIVYDSLNSQYYIVSNYTDYETILYISDTTYTELSKHLIPFKVFNLFIIDDDNLLLVGADVSNEDNSINGKAMLWSSHTSSGQIVIDNVPLLSDIDKIGSNFWIGTAEGLHIFDNSYKQKEQIDLGINKPYVLCLKQIENDVYIGTYGGGLFVVNQDSKKIISHYDKSNFLSDNIVAAIEQDNDGHIWLSTFNGINVLDQSGHIISKIMDYDGISHREMNTNAISKDKNGNIYFGTLNGMTKLNPSEVLDWSSSYGLHAEHATAYYGKNGKVIDIKEKPISIEVGFDSLLLSLVFPDYVRTLFDTPINYLKVNDQTKKRLSQDNRQLLLTSDVIKNQPKLKLTNSTKNIQETLIFNPKLDYTKALIGILVLLCILGLLSVLFYRQKISRVVIEQDKKIEINKRISELELSALQSQMNPHFIFNALGAIQYFIQTQKTEEADNFLADFALLMRKILESSKKKYLSLREEKEILELYINLEQLRFEGLFDFRWHIEDDVDMEMLIPPMILQPFIENAINHGLYNMKDNKGELSIYIDQKADNIIECIIKDNGIGRKQAAKLRNKKHKPRGLEIIKERINTLNSLNDLEIKIDTIDLYENNQPSGTTAIIEIKYDNLAFKK